MDAGNLLKPALASGSLRCIGSTTFSDVKQSFDKDRALSRRFQKIDVLEPSESETLEILKGLRPHYESHRGVKYGLGPGERGDTIGQASPGPSLAGQGHRRGRRGRRGTSWRRASASAKSVLSRSNRSSQMARVPVQAVSVTIARRWRASTWS